ncbi:putative F-box/kelch-repeat protein [Cardamine amara subsp. amara]|uniref:F-box/kelch-repeat protein n=1 Tax=Cardamine amara subsp. amara TaxID=228776 RepID=A0ABD1C9Q1_CARAN
MFGGVSLKGNTYFRALERCVDHIVVDHIICFDFTSQRFGPLLPLPFSVGVDDYVTLACVSGEKLAALLQYYESNPYMTYGLRLRLRPERCRGASS